MKKIALLAILLLSVSAVQAGEPVSGVWELYCNVDFAYDGAEPLSMFNLPDGTGAPFSQAQLLGGTVVDATLRVQLLDGFYQPIAYFPAEDMWLESTDDGMVPCLGGSMADSNTDLQGWTVWAEPLNAGGSSSASCRLIVNGMMVDGWVDLPLQFNSADMNGDGFVNLADVSEFASIFYGSYSYAADFHYDGVINLGDIGNLASGMATSCP